MKPSERLLADLQPRKLPNNDNERQMELRQLLDRLRIQEIQRARVLRDRDSSTPGDEGDYAASEDDIDLSSWLADIAASRRAEVENALQRAECGDYGLCEDCGEEISAARLRAVPTAVLCVDCQQARETGARRIRSDSASLWITAGSSPAPSSINEEDGADSSLGERRRGRRRGSRAAVAAGGHPASRRP